MLERALVRSLIRKSTFRLHFFPLVDVDFVNFKTRAFLKDGFKNADSYS